MRQSPAARTSDSCRRPRTAPRFLARAGAVLGAMLALPVMAAQDPQASVLFAAAATPGPPPAAAIPLPAASDAAPAAAGAADLRLANTLVIGAGVAGVAAYGFAKWWDAGFDGTFTTGDEGWFGQDTRYGGADKVGHAYSAYAGVRMASALLQSYGNPPAHAADLAFWSTLGTLTAVEVADGFSKQYTFSWQDAAMNALGAGFAWWVEKDPAVDAVLDFRLLYRQSSESSSWDPAGDYSGQTYLLVAKASGIPALREVPVLRYLEVALGYGTRGYDGSPGSDPSRNVYYGLQINLSALLNDTVFAEGRWPRLRRGSEVFFDLWQVPYSGAYAKSRL